MIRTRAQLVGVGIYLPENLVTNDDLAKTMDTSDAWIRERTGIRQRYLAGPHETCAFMATRAAQAALAKAGMAGSEVGAVILAPGGSRSICPRRVRASCMRLAWPTR